MENFQKLELQYAKMLRDSSYTERKILYTKAYNAVSAAVMTKMTSKNPEHRTAGTSPALVKIFVRLCRSDDKVLEVGCGRGYTCCGLARHVESIVGTDVSEPALKEANQLLRKYNITNARVLQLGADELTQEFEESSFDKVISIDVYEHLHPEDARKHLEEVYTVLKPGGKYIIVSPNRINGPHDITRSIFPDAKEALGFHLNESTYKEIMQNLRQIGFHRFCTFFSLSLKLPILPDIWYPAWINLCIENVLEKKKKRGPLWKLFEKGFLTIRLITTK